MKLIIKLLLFGEWDNLYIKYCHKIIYYFILFFKFVVLVVLTLKSSNFKMKIFFWNGIFIYSFNIKKNKNKFNFMFLIHKKIKKKLKNEKK